MQYLNDKKTTEQRKCFICQTEIERTEEISNENNNSKTKKMDIDK